MATKIKSKQSKVTAAPQSSNGSMRLSTRIPVQKTYKLYIGGKFPRTESGRYYQVKNGDQFVANICRSSRKDFRNAVKISRNSFSSDWSKYKSFVRGHIMYRIAEMLEARRDQFISELVALGDSQSEATKEVDASIDRLIHYAGWSDKYQQLFSAVNPTNTAHFNFSVFEPMGIVGIIAPEKHGLLGLISTIVPVILGGNVCTIVPSKNYGSIAISLGEVLATSDVPGGVVNVLTGFEKELAPQIASHMDVNAMLYCGNDSELVKASQQSSSKNVKRFKQWEIDDWYGNEAQNPYLILDFQEVKTTWHPIGF